jgi:hypothetical protein
VVTAPSHIHTTLNNENITGSEGSTNLEQKVGDINPEKNPQ